MMWFPYFKIESRPADDSEPPACETVPLFHDAVLRSAMETLQVHEMFLNSLIQNLSVHFDVSPFHESEPTSP